MALCLYHPEFGYYTQGREHTGVEGDYFTSSDLHPVFARLVARQAIEMWECLGKPQPFTWAEMGAGRGFFAVDFLGWTKRARPDFAAALDYVAVEPSQRQRRNISRRLEEAGHERQVRLLQNIEELESLTGCFFSNELVDAFPASVVVRHGGRLKEVYVTAAGGELREKLGPLSDSSIAAYVARYANYLAEGHRVEVCRQAQEWIRAVAAKLARGFLITIDYGETAERLYAPDHPRGTLLAYRGHTAGEDFFTTPGQNDLTAHVNFTALIDAGKAVGLELAGFTTQERFLLALGEANEFADVYERGESELQRLAARLKLKRLISPEGMGNVFKVLIQRRGVPQVALTGLKFERGGSAGKHEIRDSELEA